MNYRIGEVASLVGMTVEGLRFYERRGLVTPAARTPSGYRVYREAQVRLLHFIRAAQEMGFSLREIEGLIALRQGDVESCRAMCESLTAKRQAVRRKIRLLQALERDLVASIETCEAQMRSGDADQCPVLESLEAGGLSALIEKGMAAGSRERMTGHAADIRKRLAKRATGREKTRRPGK